MMNHAEGNAVMYKKYFSKRAENRNDLLTNCQVTWQILAQKHSKIKALQHISPNPANVEVLDVGCGTGESLLIYLELGFSMSQLTGIDIWDEQIEKGKQLYSNMNLQCQDASAMPFSDGAFDIVTESTMFLQMTDDTLAKSIASEMIRVLKPKGHIILTDWRYGKPRNPEFSAVNKKRISKLFNVGQETECVKCFNGALVPPLGRFLSQYMPAMYMPVKYLFPFTTGMVTTVLRRL